MKRRSFLNKAAGAAGVALPWMSAHAAQPCMPSRLSADGGGTVTSTCPTVGAAGSVAHGQSVTITGSGFGSTMPTFGFAGGANGPLESTALNATPSSPANTAGQPTAVAGFNWSRFAAVAVVGNDANRGKCLVHSTAGSGECSQEYRFPSSVAPGGKIMVKYHARYAVKTVPNSTNQPQYKLARLNAGESHVEDHPNSMVFTYHLPNGGNMAYSNSGSSDSSDTWYLGSDTNLPRLDGQWQRVEQKFVVGTQGQFNGQLHYRASRNAVTPFVARTGASSGRQLQSQVFNYSNDKRYIAFMWQNWFGNGYGDADFALDDHFVQIGSFACVELWNDPNPALATQREIQEPTSWGDSSITVRLNKGAFKSGAAVYLVVLADTVADTVLASKQITLA